MEELAQREKEERRLVTKKQIEKIGNRLKARVLLPELENNRDTVTCSFI
jgi:hypothetical protein